MSTPFDGRDVDGREGDVGDVLECDDIVSRLHGRDALAYRLDDSCTLVTQDDGKRALGVLAR